MAQKGAGHNFLVVKEEGGGKIFYETGGSSVLSKRDTGSFASYSQDQFTKLK